MATKIAAQDLDIASLKAMIKMLEDKDGGVAEPSGEDTTIKERNLETEEEAAIEKSIERGSNDTEELVNVLTSLDAASILTSRVQVVSVPPATKFATVSVPTGSEEELHMLIDGLDRNNETVAKYLQEYEQFATDLSIEERIELINDLVKYQGNYAKVLKYQSQQRKPISKKQKREFYVLVLKSHSGWKTKHFKGMSLEKIREKFIPIWKQIEDFVPMVSKEEGERVKRKGLRLEQESAKKVKTSEEVSAEDLKIRKISYVASHVPRGTTLPKHGPLLHLPCSSNPSYSINSHQSLGSRFFYLRTLFEVFSSTPVLAPGHSGWKTKHFKGMSLEKIREKFIPIWKQIEDFVPMVSKEEGERVKRKGLRLEQESAKKVKTSEEVSAEDLKIRKISYVASHVPRGTTVPITFVFNVVLGVALIIKTRFGH
uniref:Uncharacterized protein n=1 Tax=Tanacetum cinerariifolium TaxID=118510 RepID=A0A6L2KE57_TANCI|nr:hypothetical protein [Tanacetum cinerariifolium]